MFAHSVSKALVLDVTNIVTTRQNIMSLQILGQLDFSDQPIFKPSLVKT